MKKEQFYELLGDVDESAVKAAEDPPVKKTKKRWIKYGAIAAACLVAVTGVGIGYRISGSKSQTVLGTAKRKKMLLAAAVYPEMPAYPDESAYDLAEDNDHEAFMETHEAFMEAIEKWWDARRALRDQPEGYTDGFDVFFANSTKAFLSDAGTENMIYSPLSLYMALGMSAEITDGNTRRQILDALAQDDIETLRSHAKSIWLANYLDDGIAKCVLATSLWTNKSITYNKNTVDTLAGNYYSSVFTGDPGSGEYNELLRAWLNEQTDGLLSDHVSGVEMTPETVLTLASTVNYSGKWNHKFSEEDTVPGTFRSPNGDVQCDFMNSSRTTYYYWGDKFTSVTLNLADNGQMRLILPDEGVSAEELLNDRGAMDHMMVMKGLEYTTSSKYVTVNLSVPKFDVSSRIDLEDGLNKLGITDIFDPVKSDFTPLTDSVDVIALSQAEQAARVMIDEEGCKAAAFTVMLDAGAMPPQDKVDFVLDRPFIFELISENGLPLFVGIVNDPSQ